MKNPKRHEKQKLAAVLLLLATLGTGLVSCAAKDRGATENTENADAEKEANETEGSKDENTARHGTDKVFICRDENGYFLYNGKNKNRVDITVSEGEIDDCFLTSDGNTAFWYALQEPLYRLDLTDTDAAPVVMTESVGNVSYFSDDRLVYRNTQTNELYGGNVFSPELIDRDVRRYCIGAIRDADRIPYEKYDGGSYIKKSGASPELVCEDPSRIRTIVSDGSVVYTEDGSEGNLIRYYGNGNRKALYSGVGGEKLEELLYYTDDFSEYIFMTDDESLYHVKDGETTLIASGPLAVETDTDDGHFYYMTYPYGNDEIGDIYFYDGEKANFAFGLSHSIEEEQEFSLGERNITLYSRAVTEDDEGDNNLVLSDGKNSLSFSCDDYCDSFAYGDTVYIGDKSGITAIKYGEDFFGSPERITEFSSRASNIEIFGAVDGTLVYARSDENGDTVFAGNEELCAFLRTGCGISTDNSVYFIAVSDGEKENYLYRYDGKTLQKLLSQVDDDIEKEKDALFCLAEINENEIGTVYKIADGEKPEAVIQKVDRFTIVRKNGEKG